MASKARPLYRPSFDFATRKIPAFALKAGFWMRLHQAHLDPVYFSKNEGNRFSPPGGACGVLYVGEDAETCILEKFGDIIYGYRQRSEVAMLADSIWRSAQFTQLWIPSLTVCDLTDGATLQACGVDLAALTHPDLEVPQAWAAAVMDHPARFDAIRYLSRFTNRPCLAIFDRASAIRRRQAVGPLAGQADGDRVLEKFQVALI